MIRDLNLHVIISHRECYDNFWTIWYRTTDENWDADTCAMHVNWNIPLPQINDVGFIHIRSVETGDTYVTPSGETKQYAYTQKWLIDFIKDPKEKDDLIL